MPLAVRQRSLWRRGSLARSEEDFQPLLKVNWTWRVSCVFSSLVRSNSPRLFSVGMLGSLCQSKSRYSGETQDSCTDVLQQYVQTSSRKYHVTLWDCFTRAPKPRATHCVVQDVSMCVCCVKFRLSFSNRVSNYGQLARGFHFTAVDWLTWLNRNWQDWRPWRQHTCARKLGSRKMRSVATLSAL